MASYCAVGNMPACILAILSGGSERIPGLWSVEYCQLTTCVHVVVFIYFLLIHSNT